MTTENVEKDPESTEDSQKVANLCALGGFLGALNVEILNLKTAFTRAKAPRPPRNSNPYEDMYQHQSGWTPGSNNRLIFLCVLCELCAKLLFLG
jgi:hypothetical protein